MAARVGLTMRTAIGRVETKGTSWLETSANNALGVTVGAL